MLLNDAGILATGDILSVSLPDFDRVLAVSMRGSFVVGQAVPRAIVAQNTRSAIINMSSINAVMAMATPLSYTASKGGIAQLTRSLALGLVQPGIRVNAIGPGTIDTEIIRPLMGDERARKMILSRTPLRRLGEAAEVAKVVVFLASEDASYITGQTIYPDGGTACAQVMLFRSDS